jgi:signal transduction histidine kinase
LSIRLKAWLGVGLASLLVLLTFAALSLTNSRLKDAQAASESLAGVLKDSFVLQHLTGEYWRRPTARVREQWDVTAEILGARLDSFKCRGDAEMECLVRINLAHDDIRRLFSQTVSAVGREGEGVGVNGSRLSEGAERFAGQLFLRMQSVVSEVSILHAMVDARRKTVRLWERRISVGCLLLLAVTLIGGSLWAEHTIVRPLTMLRDGTGVIGSGNLNHRVATTANDEVGELSRAFDQMVDDLKSTMASRDELNIEVAQRRQAEAELARSNQELEQFGYSASHDLQEPLRKIIAFSDRVAAGCRDQMDEKYQDYLDRVQNAAFRMQALIDALLAYSRVTTKAKPFESVDLSATAEGVLSDLEFRISETGGEVRLKDLPVLDAEPVQMQQLLQNLIANALKFKREDVPPLIEVTGEAAGVDDERGEMCRITVRDNGIGFDPKFADRIFLVFQRLHGRGTYEGTGIGLALCKKIVDRHGGTITVDSTPGEGTVFTVTLPKQQAVRG